MSSMRFLNFCPEVNFDEFEKNISVYRSQFKNVVPGRPCYDDNYLLACREKHNALNTYTNTMQELEHTRYLRERLYGDFCKFMPAELAYLIVIYIPYNPTHLQCKPVPTKPVQVKKVDMEACIDKHVAEFYNLHKPIKRKDKIKTSPLRYNNNPIIRGRRPTYSDYASMNYTT